MGDYGGPVSFTRGSGGANIARQFSSQAASYAASGARATAARKTKQAAEATRAAELYLKAARAGQKTVFTREPERDTAAYQAKQMILIAEAQATKEKKAAEEKRIAEIAAAAKAAEEKRIKEETERIIGTACPRGGRYAPEGFEKCDAGYHETWEGWFPTRNRYCDCDVSPPTGEADKKGVTDVLGALSKGEININSIILAAAIVMLIISLIKR